MYFYEEYAVEYRLANNELLRVDQGCSPGFVWCEDIHSLIKSYLDAGWLGQYHTDKRGKTNGYLFYRSMFLGVATELTTIIVSTEPVNNPEKACPPSNLPPASFFCPLPEDYEYEPIDEY